MRGAASITENSKISLVIFWTALSAAVFGAIKVGSYISQSEASARAQDDTTRAMERIDRRLGRMDRRQALMDYRQSRIEQALDLKPLPTMRPDPIDDPE
jgi:hypothetical protein